MNQQPPDRPPMQLLDTRRYKRKWLDLPYAGQSPNQCLDLYLPDEGDGPFPVIAAIHGGAFMFGSKREIINEPMLKGLERGFAVACIEYRLSGEAIFPALVYDAKAAIRFLRANAEQYHLDGDRIGAWGPSAGGYQVAMLGTSAGVKELEDLSMGNAEVSSAVQVVVDWCGPAASFLTMDDDLRESGFGIPDHSEAQSPESLLLGKQITEVPELVRIASPMTYVLPDVPPFLIQHGSIDPIVPFQQSFRLAEAIERTAGKERVTLEILPGVGHHGDPAFETDENVNRVLDYLEEHLKKSRKG